MGRLRWQLRWRRLRRDRVEGHLVGKESFGEGVTFGKGMGLGWEGMVGA